MSSGFLEAFAGLANSFVNGYAEGRALRGSSRGGVVERLCGEAHWGIDERDGNRSYLDFRGKSGLTWRVSITEEDTFVRFLVVTPTKIPFAKAGPVLAYLLLKNIEVTIGGWVGSRMDDGDVAVGMIYRAFSDGLTAAAFQCIVQSLIAEAEEFEAKVRS